jgi:peptidoglycan hydrolase CwlO-like protein
MKRTIGIFAALLMTMTISMAAYAANSESKSITLFQAVQVNGTTLQPGTYKVTFDAATPSTQVTFLKGKKEIASTQAQVMSLPQKQSDTQIKMNTVGTTQRLDEIDFRGTSTGIKFSETTINSGE